MVNVVLRYASNSGNPNLGNPGYPPGSSSHAPAGNSRHVQQEGAINPSAGNPTSSSGPSSNAPLSSVHQEEHSRPQLGMQEIYCVLLSVDRSLVFIPFLFSFCSYLIVITADSDSSSSDTSFEMVPRPSSHENITGGNSLSTSTSTSTSTSSPSPVSEAESAVTADAAAPPLEEDPTAAFSKL